MLARSLSKTKVVEAGLAWHPWVSDVSSCRLYVAWSSSTKTHIREFFFQKESQMVLFLCIGSPNQKKKVVQNVTCFCQTRKKTEDIVRILGKSRKKNASSSFPLFRKIRKISLFETKNEEHNINRIRDPHAHLVWKRESIYRAIIIFYQFSQDGKYDGPSIEGSWRRRESGFRL